MHTCRLRGALAPECCPAGLPSDGCFRLNQSHWLWLSPSPEVASETERSLCLMSGNPWLARMDCAREDRDFRTYVKFSINSKSRE